MSVAGPPADCTPRDPVEHSADATIATSATARHCSRTGRQQQLSRTSQGHQDCAMAGPARRRCRVASRAPSVSRRTTHTSSQFAEISVACRGCRRCPQDVTRWDLGYSAGSPLGGAMGVILGAYRQVATEGEATNGPFESVLSEMLDVFRAGEGVDPVRDAVRLVMQELIELTSPGRSAPAATSAPTRVSLIAMAVARGWSRRRPETSSYASPRCARFRSSVDPRTTPADRPSVVRGYGRRPRQRGVEPFGRRLGRRAGC